MNKTVKILWCAYIFQLFHSWINNNKKNELMMVCSWIFLLRVFCYRFFFADVHFYWLIIPIVLIARSYNKTRNKSNCRQIKVFQIIKKKKKTLHARIGISIVFERLESSNIPLHSCKKRKLLPSYAPIVMVISLVDFNYREHWTSEHGKSSSSPAIGEATMTVHDKPKILPNTITIKICLVFFSTPSLWHYHDPSSSYMRMAGAW